MRRVALIGAGFIARVHAEALQSLRGVQVSAVVDPKRDAAARPGADLRGSAGIRLDR